MSDFSSMEEFLRELWRVQELQDRHEETHDEFILEAEIDIWQRILPHPYTVNYEQAHSTQGWNKGTLVLGNC